ncbi:recombinase family protein [Sulfitobacter sp. JL08]|uniref:recombinase family protein n=1 Tax=Sulfitobacter sp. JL08 TaxID=2070369 RepID=UPI00268F3C37
MKYVVYQRVSTKGQGESGLGLDAQERDIQLYLDNYVNDYSVIGRFTDIVSGKVNDRPELTKAIALAKESKATLLVSKLDRLSRKVSFIATLMDDKNLDLKVAQMPHADMFQLHIYAALAQQEREFISKRTKAALKEAKARGVILGGLRRGTEQRNEATKAQADHRANHVFPMIEAFRAKGMTLKETAQELNRLGIETARGGNWYASTVRNVEQRMAP